MAGSQSRTVLSFEADASVLPSGEKAMAVTEPLWPVSVCWWAPVAGLQSRTVLSSEADASVLPSGEKATAVTQPLWPVSVCWWAPVAGSQSRTVLSCEADASVLPSGEKATAVTQPLWPSSVCWCASQYCLVSALVAINDSLFAHCVARISLDIGLNTSAEPYACNGACSMIDL